MRAGRSRGGAGPRSQPAKGQSARARAPRARGAADAMFFFRDLSNVEDSRRYIKFVCMDRERLRGTALGGTSQKCQPISCLRNSPVAIDSHTRSVAVTRRRATCLPAQNEDHEDTPTPHAHAARELQQTRRNRRAQCAGARQHRACAEAVNQAAACGTRAESARQTTGAKAPCIGRERAERRLQGRRSASPSPLA